MTKDYVVGIGDNVVDYYQNKNVKFPGGNSVNFTVFAPKNLVDSYYVGSVADDADGNMIIKSLNSEGVNTSFCNRIEGQTEKTCVNIVDGDRQFVSFTRGKRMLPPLNNKLMELCKNALVVYSGCHSKTEEALKKIHDLGGTTAYDFSEMEKYHTNEYLNKMAPNVDIAQFSLEQANEDDQSRLLEICLKFGISYVLFTRGGKVPLLYDFKGNCYTGVVNYNPNPVDTMGAGDTFFANLAVLLAKHRQKNLLIPKQEIIDSLTLSAEAAERTIMREGSYGYGEKIK